MSAGYNKSTSKPNSQEVLMIYFEICHHVSEAPYAFREIETTDPIKTAIELIKKLETNVEGHLSCKIDIGNMSTRQVWEPISKRTFHVVRTEDTFTAWEGRECMDLKAGKRKIKAARAFYKI
jgi:hypothetical protein